MAQYLADALLIYVLRASAERAGHAPGRLPATQDRYLARAFALMHAEPDRQWTIAHLASEVGLSRATVTGVARQVGYLSQAAFARAFKRHAGVAQPAIAA